MNDNTIVIRVIPLPKLKLKIPLYSGVSAGFPSPADDYIEQELNLDELLIKNPEATFFVRVSGNSMIGAGMYTGDILIVDCSLEARPGDVVIAVLEGQFTVKRLIRKGGKYFLKPENPAYSLIELHEATEFRVWGVVTHVIHKP
jgi:DNA polymerase V